MGKILSILLLLFIGNVVYSQSVCEKAIRQARSDFKKSRYFFHSEELLPVENTYLYVLREYYKINWRFIDPSKYYDCYDSTMNVLLTQKYGNDYLDRAHAITDSLERIPNWIRDASFPGGRTEMYKYLQNKLDSILKKDSKNNGTVWVKIELDNLGKIVNVKVVKGISTGLDNSIIKVFKEMPTWMPAYLYSKTKPYIITLPVRIEGENITNR